MKKVLVTGGAGFMGANFIHFLSRLRPEISIINLDLLTYAGNLANLDGIKEEQYTFVHGDIADESVTGELFKKVDTVINFAAETHVDRSIHEDAKSFVHTNIQGVQTLLEALRKTPNVERMLHVSTDEVWGDLPLDSKEQFNEESPFRPNSPYAASKAGGDLLIRAYVKTYGLPVIVTHSVNNFGPRQFPEKLIPFFISLAKAGRPLPLYGDGKNIRDWLYVDDHSNAILTVLEKGKLGEVYNISSGEEWANIDIAHDILRILKKPENLITFVKDRPAHDRRYSVDSQKLRLLGWEPKNTFDEKLESTIAWYGSNPDWMQDILRKNEKINYHITSL